MPDAAQEDFPTAATASHKSTQLEEQDSMYEKPEELSQTGLGKYLVGTLRLLPL